jgi:hypothetical protein
MRRLPQIPRFLAKSQVLEIHAGEKNFKDSHTQKGETHKVEVLERIYFSTTG